MSKTHTSVASQIKAVYPQKATAMAAHTRKPDGAMICTWDVPDRLLCLSTCPQVTVLFGDAVIPVRAAFSLSRGSRWLGDWASLVAEALFLFQPDVTSCVPRHYAFSDTMDRSLNSSVQTNLSFKLLLLDVLLLQWGEWPIRMETCPCTSKWVTQRGTPHCGILLSYLTQATTWMNPENTVREIKEMNRSRKDKYSVAT